MSLDIGFEYSGYQIETKSVLSRWTLEGRSLTGVSPTGVNGNFKSSRLKFNSPPPAAEKDVNLIIPCSPYMGRYARPLIWKDAGREEEI